MRRLRILQVISDTDRRGAQMFALDLGSALRARGHDVTTVAVVPGGNDERVDVPALGPRRFGPSTVRGLRAAMGRNDVTIAHGSSSLPACALASIGGSRPFVYRQVSDSRFWAPTRLRRLRVRIAMQRAAHLVSLTEDARRNLSDWIGIDPNDVTVVPNGVPSEPFTVTDPDRRRSQLAALSLPDLPTILCVAALAPEKDLDTAIEAVARLDDAQLVIAGDGPLRGELEALGSRLAPGRVHFLGARRDMPSIYAAGDVVLSTSISESMPGTLIEAGMAGLPAVATAVGAVPEIVVADRTGVLVPPGDAAAVATALDRVLHDRTLADRLGAEARRYCLEHFEIGVVAAAWEQVLVHHAAARRD